MTTKVDIGVLEQKTEWLLHPRFFPSKVGGKPAWLDLKNYPELSCKCCNERLIFLCQIYAPYEESDECFHRTIFIFVCRNKACCWTTNSSENFLVLRCQLPRKNDFYSFHPYVEKEEEVLRSVKYDTYTAKFPMDGLPKLCELCGAKAPSHCSKCKKVYYCGRSHQILDWKNGHKENCFQANQSVKPNNFVVAKSGKSILLKEWELVVDEEDQEDVKDVDINQEMEKLQKLMHQNKAGTLENVSESELEEYAKEMPEDKVFNKFSKRVARHPEQVLRYDRGGSPLWITELVPTCGSDKLVPNCEYCSGERQFEFQIMPQMLNFIESETNINSMDWGVLAIYTCKASCNAGPAYKEEFMIKQDLI